MIAKSKKNEDALVRGSLSNECAPEVVKRNKDTEGLLLATAKYGIHGGGIENKGKLFTLLCAADAHGDDVRFARFTDYLNYYPHFDAGICLGDIAPSNFSEEDGERYKSLVLSQNKEFHTVLGNHDLGNSKKKEISATVEMGFSKFIKPLEEKTGLSSLTEPYYLRLYDAYKVALIVLNSYDTPSETDENGSYKVSRGTEMFGEKQIKWLTETLMTIPEGYHLIVASHTLPYELQKVDSPFTDRHRPVPCPATAAYANNYMIDDIIDAWARSEALTRDYAPVLYSDILPSISVKCDFKKRGKGEFACYLLGHKHADIIARTPSGRLAIYLGSLACDLWQNEDSDLPRTVGARSEDLMTSISLDTEARSMRLVRIGSDMTVDLTERKYTVLNY